MAEHPATLAALSAAAPGASASSGVTKKKFAAPPVKSACLACRRGGPRCRKKPRPGRSDEPKQLPDDVFALLSQEPADVPRDPISIQNYIDPGAGLKHLEDWVQDSDLIFDSLFMNSTGPALDAYYVFIHPFLPILPPPDHVPVDRPIPRLQNQIDVFEEGFEPTSPISLAISAILALIPCPEDVNHASRDSQLFRRKYAQYFAQTAFETMENDEEIPDSAIDPSRPLSEDHNHAFRQPFHARVPVELESIIALDILSVYEYAQRGNIKKMQNRAGQALMAAMDMSLHSCATEDEYSEARRRYVCVAQGAIVSNTKPSFASFSPSFTAKFPTFAADPEAFAAYIQAQRAIMAATQFVIELNKAVRDNADLNPIYEHMKELEALLEPLLSHSETWMLTSTTTSPVAPGEAVVARSLRCMASIKLNSARIKLHRYCAFFDIPVFSRKHCDLKSLRDTDNNPGGGDEPRRWPTCSCSSFANPFTSISATPASSTTGGGGGASSIRSPSSDGAGPLQTNFPMAAAPFGQTQAAMMTAQQQQLQQQQQQQQVASFPFSSHQSAKICLKSALNIAHSFDELPFPNPTGVVHNQLQQQSLGQHAQAGCAYALLMVHQKTKSMYPYSAEVASIAGGAGGGAVPNSNNGHNGSGGVIDGGGNGGNGNGTGAPRPLVVNSLLVRLQQGLTSIYATLSNYSTAFEALGGMRDQIRIAIEESQAFTVAM
ncbi:putative c6 zinc finger domain-containing protein [Diaporthe ampelina]|uniref:Putative c6 zinc finger domain-containing protein n=1 Tax=Diaporthe ampelina TaxID=1214573 RepID=A0A0G2HSM3_9PEZI|nr:putative c6 zinc finger domain-containing protein [Diaporthe ampelina]